MAFRELRKLVPTLAAAAGLGFGAYRYKANAPNTTLVTEISANATMSSHIAGLTTSTAFNTSISSISLRTHVMSESPLPTQIPVNTTFGSTVPDHDAWMRLIFELLDIALVLFFELPYFRQLLATMLLWLLNQTLRAVKACWRVIRGIILSFILYNLFLLFTRQLRAAHKQEIDSTRQELLFTKRLLFQSNTQLQDSQQTSNDVHTRLQQQLAQKDIDAASDARVASTEIARVNTENGAIYDRVCRQLDPSGKYRGRRIPFIVSKVTQAIVRRAKVAEKALAEEKECHKTTRNERDMADWKYSTVQAHRDQEMTQLRIGQDEVQVQQERFEKRRGTVKNLSKNLVAWSTQLKEDQATSRAEFRTGVDAQADARAQISELKQAHSAELTQLNDTLADTEEKRQAAEHTARTRYAENAESYETKIKQGWELTKQNRKVKHYEGMAEQLEQALQIQMGAPGEVKELKAKFKALLEKKKTRFIKAYTKLAKENKRLRLRLVGAHNKRRTKLSRVALPNEGTRLTKMRTAKAKAQAEEEQAEGLTRKNAELEGQLAAFSEEKRRREEELRKETEQLERKLANARRDEGKRKAIVDETDQLKRELDVLKDETRRMEDEKREKERLERELAALRKEKGKMEESRSEEKKAMESGVQEKEQLEKKLAALDEDKKKMEASHSAALVTKEKEAADRAEAARRSGHREALTERDEEAANAMQIPSSTEDELRESREALRAAQSAIQDRDVQANNLTQQVQQLQQQNLVSQGQVQGLLHEGVEARARYASLEGVLQNWQNEVQRQNSQLQTAQSTIDNLQTRHTSIVSGLEATIGTLKTNLQQKDAQLAAVPSQSNAEQMEALANDKARLLRLLEVLCATSRGNGPLKVVFSGLVNAERYLGVELKDGDDLRASLEDPADEIAWQVVDDALYNVVIDGSAIKQLARDPSKRELVTQAISINNRLAELSMYVSNGVIKDEEKKYLVATLLLQPRQEMDVETWVTEYDVAFMQAFPASTYPEPGSSSGHQANTPSFHPPSTLQAPSTSSLSNIPGLPGYQDPAQNLPEGQTLSYGRRIHQTPAVRRSQAGSQTSVVSGASSSAVGTASNPPSTGYSPFDTSALDPALHGPPNAPPPASAGTPSSNTTVGANNERKRKPDDDGQVDFSDEAFASKRHGKDITSASRHPTVPPEHQPDASAGPSQPPQ